MVFLAPRARPCYAVREVIYVDNDMGLMLSRLYSLIAEEPDVDLVQTKFGWVLLENASKEGLELCPVELVDFDAVCRALFCELDSHVAREREWRDMTEEDAAELRRLVLPYIEGLDKESHAQELLEEFIAHALSLAYHPEPAF